MGSVDGSSLRHRVGESRPTAPQKPLTHGPRQQQPHQRGVAQRTDHRGFHQPVVMNDSTDSAVVNGAAEHAPAAPAGAAYPAGGGSNRERNEQGKGATTTGDEVSVVTGL